MHANRICELLAFVSFPQETNRLVPANQALHLLLTSSPSTGLPSPAPAETRPIFRSGHLTHLTDSISSLVTAPHTIFKADVQTWLCPPFLCTTFAPAQIKKKSSPTTLFSHCDLRPVSTYLQPFLSDHSLTQAMYQGFPELRSCVTEWSVADGTLNKALQLSSSSELQQVSLPPRKTLPQLGNSRTFTNLVKLQLKPPQGQKCF